MRLNNYDFHALHSPRPRDGGNAVLSGFILFRRLHLTCMAYACRMLCECRCRHVQRDGIRGAGGRPLLAVSMNQLKFRRTVGGTVTAVRA